MKGPLRQRGSLLVISLFVLIVGALLGVTMVRLLSASSQSVIYEVTGQRAFNAANSGLQQLLAGSFPVGGSPTVCNGTITSDAAFSQIDGLQNCQYEARCSTTELLVAGQTRQYVRLSSTGYCAAGSVIVSRTVAADAVQQEQ
ncbi:type II secretory pathway protein [Aestuariibacter salexigens]|uniref:type II secretory pathway protein n=1 Tax=Aestuariibacter salexigens TaxID=226010 RepID=UPI001F0AB0F9|nr:type II secretory pathway protein [Aestuariibacter salexigens]